MPDLESSKAPQGLGTATEPEHYGAHQLFEQQAAVGGGSVAVICGEQRLTYSELNSRANQLAEHLRGLGVRPEVLVALCMTRGLDMVVGILGILKAGGAWMPLDPRHPKDRKQTVLEDAKAPFLLTERVLTSELPKCAAQTVLIDGDWARISTGIASNPENIAESSNLAYVMFTSGSTGQPKGVMVTHANLYQYVCAMRVSLAITKTDIYLHTASIAFSSSVRQLFLPLTSGATLLIATVDQLQEPLSLFEAVKNQKVTVLDLVPSYWRHCMDALSALDSSARTQLLANSVRLIATASEVLAADLPGKWRRDFKHGAQLINMFGQTETTGIVSTYTIPSEDPLDVTTIPVGRPIADTHIYLLDDQQIAVPAGNLGEIYVAGAGVGRGYLNRPESTAERFLPNPFGTKGGDRLYKTGDLARRRPDGNIEFVGRMDDQVKIRGIRIEPGEVTAVLNQCPDLKESVVVGEVDEQNNRRLIGYVVPLKGRKLSTSELREYLGDRLPEYMVPSSFVTLEALPLLASGKVDRLALRNFHSNDARPDSANTLVSPRTDLERNLVAIWQSALAVGAISVLDNFFDLGGNSLAAMYVLTCVVKTFGAKLSVADLFQAPTVEEFAKLLDHQRQPTMCSSLVPLQPQGFHPPFFWIHGESSNAQLPRYLGLEQPVYGLGHQSLDGVPARFTTVETIAAHYLEQIRTIQPHGPYYLGGYCFGGLIAFEIAHQLKSHSDDVALVAVVEPRPLRSYGGSTLPPSVQSNHKEGILKEGLRHLRTLKTLKLRQALSYFGRRVQDKVSEWVSIITGPVTRTINKAVCAFCIRYNFTLPVWVRSFYILRVYRRAGQNYNLRTYPGRVTLFEQEPQYLSSSSWEGLATEGVEIHQVPAATHTAILLQPHLRDWARELKTVLYRARERASGPR